MFDAISLYTFQDKPVAELIEEFAGYGFDAFSFNREMFVDGDAADLVAAGRAIQRNGYGATLHSSFCLTGEELAEIRHLLGESLRGVTFDSARIETSSGTFFDTNRMAPVLREVGRRLGSDAFFGVEDFPLDGAAVDFYREALGDLLDDKRFGILIDLGHMNMRLRTHPYYDGETPEQYLAAVPLRIHEVHVHDNAGDRDSHGPLGFGNLDVSAAAHGLLAGGFAGVSTIEICPRLHNVTNDEARPTVPASLARWRNELAAAQCDAVVDRN